MDDHTKHLLAHGAMKVGQELAKSGGCMVLLVAIISAIGALCALLVVILA